MIEEIFAEGNAYRDGRLCPGDRIVAVDDDDITELNLAEATLLLSTPIPLMKLTIIRNGGMLALCLSLSLSLSLSLFLSVIYMTSSAHFSTVDVELIELTRSEGNSLGIQIRTSRSRPGIFVYYLVPGSVADDSKLIHPGDCILEANGHDLRQASVDDAANYMSVSECSLLGG